MNIRLIKGSERNTRATIVTINEHTLYFSYSTCIAYRGPLGSYRIANHWGPTTGRHFSEMDIKELPIVDDKSFETILSQI